MSRLNSRRAAIGAGILACVAVGWAIAARSSVGLAAASSSALDSVDWHQWRGPNRDGLSSDTGLMSQWPKDGPPLAWTAKNLGEGFSGPSIQDGRIFTMGDRGDDQFVIALNLADGTELWSTKIGKHTGGGGYPGPRCTPAADGKYVYALASDGDLACFEAATGKLHWKLNYKKDFDGKMMSIWTFSESPLVDGDRLICTPGGKEATIVALNKFTGKTIWKCAVPDIGPNGKDGAAYSSIVISNGAGVKQYVQLLGRGLVGIEASNGKFLWGYNKIANGTANIPSPIVRGDYVFDSTGYQTGAALLKLSPKAGGGVKATEVYFLPAKELQIHHGGMVLVGDYLYGGHGHRAGAPVCVDFLTGKIVWKENHGPGEGSAGVGYADGKLYFRYENGVMALLDCSPKGYKLLSTFNIPDVTRPSWPHPVIAGGRLYLREQDKMYCYNLKE